NPTTAHETNQTTTAERMPSLQPGLDTNETLTRSTAQRTTKTHPSGSTRTNQEASARRYDRRGLQPERPHETTNRLAVGTLERNPATATRLRKIHEATIRPHSHRRLRPRRQ